MAAFCVFHRLVEEESIDLLLGIWHFLMLACLLLFHENDATVVQSFRSLSMHVLTRVQWCAYVVCICMCMCDRVWSLNGYMAQRRLCGTHITALVLRIYISFVFGCNYLCSPLAIFFIQLALCCCWSSTFIRGQLTMAATFLSTGLRQILPIDTLLCQPDKLCKPCERDSFESESNFSPLIMSTMHFLLCEILVSDFLLCPLSLPV